MAIPTSRMWAVVAVLSSWLPAWASPSGAQRTASLSEQLLSAVRSHEVNTAEHVLDAGADPNGDRATGPPIADLYNYSYRATATDLAGDLLDLLLARGADPNRRGRGATTALICAAKVADARGVRTLLEHGADPNLADRRGRTALLSVGGGTDTAEIIRTLVEHGADATARDRTGCTTLMVAAEAGCPDAVLYLAERGAPVNAHDRDGATALMCARVGYWQSAFRVPRLAVVKALLQVGSDPCAEDKRGRCALWHMASFGDTECVAELHAHGASVDARDREGVTPLAACASYFRNADVGIWLLRHGADPNARSKRGVTPLMRAAKGRSDKLAEALLAAGARVEDRDADGMTALHWACSWLPPRESGGLDGESVVPLLLRHGADANARDCQGRTPLIVACANFGDDDECRALQDAGGDVNARDKHGFSALDWRAVTGLSADVLLARGAKRSLISALALEPEEVGLRMVRRGADPNSRGPRRRTALHIASERTFAAAVEELVRLGASVNERDDLGNSALHYAVMGWGGWGDPPTATTDEDLRLRIIRALADAGADTHAPDRTGMPVLCTLVRDGGAAYAGLVSELVQWSFDPRSDEAIVAMHFAALFDRVACVDALRRAGVRVDARIANGETPLMWAANFGRSSVVAHLLECGADPDLRDKSGKTARDYALAGSEGDVIRALLDAWHAEHAAKLNRHQ